jgi:aryl-alcohol dehydrogenase-like predicted oxidoreductase
MRYSDIPGTSLKPSAICLGTGGFGSSTPEEDSFRLLDLFAENGGNFLDTAHIYAAWLANGVGASERTIGKWVKSRGNRSKIVVGTKGGHPDLKTMQISRLKPADIRQDLKESLERLQFDSVELYWLHRDDPAIQVGEILGVLNELQSEGKIGAFGCSNWSVGRIQQSHAWAQKNGKRSFCASQIAWSLALATDPPEGAGMVYMDDQTERFHRETRLPQIAYSSQANGLFAKPIPEGGAFRGGYNHAINIKRWHKTQEIAKRHGCSPNQVAVAWLLAQPFPVFPIVGAHKPEQVRDSCGAVKVTLTADEVHALAKP